MEKKMHLTGLSSKKSVFTLIIGLVFVSGSLVGCTKSNISDKKIDFISLSRAVDLYDRQQAKDDTALFIDTRKPERYAEGHIPGALNLRTPDIDLRYGTDPALERYKNLVIYGENPSTATTSAMAKRMIEAGYNGFVKKRVKVFLGGWREWEITGLDIEKSTVEPESDLVGDEQ
jgi:3-mercaptopyruvate sulfurtransferase SseA